MKPESGHPTDQTPGRTPGADRDETLAEAALRTTFARVKRAILFAPVLALLSRASRFSVPIWRWCPGVL